MLKLCCFVIMVSLFVSRSFSSELHDPNEKYLIRKKHAELIHNYMDPSVNPCEDFYQYACGNWEKHNPSQYFTQTVVQMSAQINLIIHKILSKGEYKNDIEKKATVFFASCVNDEKTNKKSLETAAEFITALGGWPELNPKWSENDFDMIKVLAKRLRTDQGSIINAGVEQDIFNSTIYSLYLVGPTTGLKNRDDYLSKHNSNNLKAYRTFILDVLKLVNAPKENVQNITNDIINFETSLTDFMFPVSQPSTERFNTTNLQSLIKNYPNFDWKKYFHEIFGYEIPINQKIIISIPSIDKLVDLISKTDKKTLANYLAWQTIFDLCENYLLNDYFVNAFIKFNNVLNGESIPSRRSVCAHKTKTYLSLIVASMFIKAINLDSNSKKEVVDTTEKIKNEFYVLLQNAKWVDAKTKNEGVLKLNHTILGIGFPDFILDEQKLGEYYKNLEEFDEDDFLRNFIYTVHFNKNKTLKKLNTRVDVNEWPDVITDVNAIFQNVKNRILLPAGILQVPVYHKYLPPVIKYGSLGFFIGHELTHGFDSNGKDYDYKGDLKSWWTQNSEKEFNEKVKCFVDQYDNYSLYGQHLSGSLTLAENIADNGAMRLAYELYKNWHNIATSEELADDQFATLKNISNDKLFFIGVTQLLCSSKIKPEVVAGQLQEEHSPPEFRVMGMLQNLPEFSEIFKCPIGSPMNPPKKCQLW